MTSPIPQDKGTPERLDLEAAELEAAVADVKRRLGVETAEARVIAARLPERLRTRFWENCIHETLGTELAIAEAAVKSGFVRPGDHERMAAELERVVQERDEARRLAERMRAVVDAAEAWREYHGTNGPLTVELNNGQPFTFNGHADADELALAAAVDLYGSFLAQPDEVKP